MWGEKIHDSCMIFCVKWVVIVVPTIHQCVKYFKLVTEVRVVPWLLIFYKVNNVLAHLNQCVPYAATNVIVAPMISVFVTQKILMATAPLAKWFGTQCKLKASLNAPNRFQSYVRRLAVHVSRTLIPHQVYIFYFESSFWWIQEGVWTQALERRARQKKHALKHALHAKCTW